jgi:GT2 family glycosyltransferase
MKNVLIGMAVYSTEENKKDDCLERTLESLRNTVNFDVHKLMLSVNAKTERTENIILKYEQLGVIDHVIYNPENLGTAEAINLVWKKRQTGQHCIKMDDDVVIYQSGWIELMIEAIRRKPEIGIIGLKRRDCWERPYEKSYEKESELIYLPQVAGEQCIIVEKANHIMGTCQLYNSNLLDKMGYLFQLSKYGYDDVMASHRSHVAGFINVFISYIDIEHIDPGNTPYQGWKERSSSEVTAQVIEIVHQWQRGERSIYYNPFTEVNA